VKVRQALNYAIDREAINETILDGQCPPTSQPLQEGEPGHDPDSAENYTYDPERAEELLAEAGFPDGFPLNMVVIAGLNPQADLASVIQAQLGEVGVDVSINAVDTVAASRIWNGGQADIYQHVRSSTSEPAVTMSSAYQAASFPGPRPAGFDELVARGSDSTQDQETRYEDLQEASAFASENAMDVFLCALPTQYAASESVVGLDEVASPYGGGFDLRYLGMTAEQ
jgi:ABC-type transport system substrate-binding protein